MQSYAEWPTSRSTCTEYAKSLDDLPRNLAGEPKNWLPLQQIVEFGHGLGLDGVHNVDVGLHGLVVGVPEAGEATEEMFYNRVD